MDSVNLNFEKHDVRVRTGFMWFMVQSSDGLLHIRYLIWGRIYWRVEQPSLLERSLWYACVKSVTKPSFN
jgi:hypothetical protein